MPIASDTEPSTVGNHATIRRGDVLTTGRDAAVGAAATGRADGDGQSGQMATASRIADRINGAIPVVKARSLCVHGDFFGRPYDNIYQVPSARTSPDGETLIVEFGRGERLETWNPRPAPVSPTVFAIAPASEVRWQWFYYARPQLPENQYYVEHLRSGDDVVVTTDRGGIPGSGEYFPHGRSTVCCGRRVQVHSPCGVARAAARHRQP